MYNSLVVFIITPRPLSESGRRRGTSRALPRSQLLLVPPHLRLCVASKLPDLSFKAYPPFPPPTPTPTHTHTHTLSLSLSHTHTHTRTLSLTHTRTLSLSHTQTHTRARTRTHARTHALSLSLSLSHTHTQMMGEKCKNPIKSAVRVTSNIRTSESDIHVFERVLYCASNHTYSSWSWIIDFIDLLISTHTHTYTHTLSLSLSASLKAGSLAVSLSGCVKSLSQNQFTVIRSA